MARKQTMLNAGSLCPCQIRQRPHAGHWLLARLGKRVLRPGVELTRTLLAPRRR